MAYKLANVYDSNGSELTNALHTTTLAGTNQMAYDGRYVWITCGTNGIAIYDHWYDDVDRTKTRPAFADIDELTAAYWTDLDSQVDGVPQNKIKLVTYLTVTSTQVKRSTCLQSQAESGATVYPRDAYGDSIYAKVNSRSGNALNAFWIKKLGDKMYVTNTNNFTEIFEFDIQTQNLVRVLTVADVYKGTTTVAYVTGMPVYTKGTSYSMLSNLEAANGKLWMVGRAWGEDQQRQVYSLDPITGATTSTNTNARPGYSRSMVANGLNGYVYVTNYNDWGVCKFNADDGSFVANIRVNGYPQGIWVGPDRKIWVTSFAGMLSLIDWDDDQVHNDYSSESIAAQAQTDPTNGGYVWFVNSSNKLVHYDLNTKKQYENGTTADYMFYNDKLTTPENFLAIPSFTYQDSALATKTVKAQLLVLTTNTLVSWFIGHTGSPDENDPLADVTYFDYPYPYTDYPYRTIYAEMTGQAAVSAGGNAYFGD